MRCFVVLLLLLLQLVATQPLYGLEKALLYSFEDPNDIEWVANEEPRRVVKRRIRLLNLMGQNSRFVEPYLRKKQRSVDAGISF